MSITDELLYKLLKENEYLTPEQLKTAQEIAHQEKTSLHDVVLEKDFITDEDLGKIIADYLHLPFVSLEKVLIPQDVLTITPTGLVRKYKTIIFAQMPDGFKAATADPDNKDALLFLAKKTGAKITLYYATENDILDTLRLYKKDLQSSFDDLVAKYKTPHKDNAKAEAPVAQVVNMLIEYAYYAKASDVHIEPREGESHARFRIDGVLHDALVMSKSMHTQVISMIKVLSKLRTDEHFSAQDGKMRINIDTDELDVRVSIVPVVEGENAVLRLLSEKARQFSLSDLGMLGRDLQIIKESYEKPYGMLLVTGPTGSGKTTTIYAILKILNVTERNIATIEDPVEYEIKGINQIQVNPKTNLTFAAGLRSILRQDPDTIFVGEIRDEETADIAINSAMTGHLVLSTLHTNDAATAVIRLYDMNIEPFLISSTVNVIIGQRLVRKICDTCRVSYTQQSSTLLKHLGKDMVKKHFGSGKEIRMYKGKGCQICHMTGYIGRVGVFEVLAVTPAIQRLIREKADSDVITAQAVKEGMISMLEDGVDKVQQGITTLEEVFRVTKEDATLTDTTSSTKLNQPASP